MDLKRFLHWAGDNLGYSALKEVSCTLPERAACPSHQYSRAGCTRTKSRAAVSLWCDPGCIMALLKISVLEPGFAGDYHYLQPGGYSHPSSLQTYQEAITHLYCAQMLELCLL